jgi:hypothetical protein
MKTAALWGANLFSPSLGYVSTVKVMDSYMDCQSLIPGMLPFATLRLTQHTSRDKAK